MKNLMKWSLSMAIVALVAVGFTSCEEGNNPEGTQELSKKEKMFKSALEDYVDNTVIYTYHHMADHSILLYNSCVEMQKAFKDGKVETSIVEEAGKNWKNSRKFWEQSEAFLYGAAGDYNIDPHIDSWPLDKNAMDALLEDIRNGKDLTIDNNLGYGLLGYHAVEYMLFKLSDDGMKSLPRTEFTKEELQYLVVVAEDLMNQCVRLEAAWAGMDNVSEEKQGILTDAELEPTIDYGWSMKNAGQAGSLYKNYIAAMQDLINGAMDIADEVGALKMGTPVKGEDPNYIESPYSLNSLTDFQDNMRSIQHAYQGREAGDNSLSEYIVKVNSELDGKVKSAIEKAIKDIAAVQEPFIKGATTPEAKTAVESVEAVLAALEEVDAAITEEDL